MQKKSLLLTHTKPNTIM